ncbi:MAG: FoF1 ATP synthase subunit gamma [Atribacterota bacterium]
MAKFAQLKRQIALVREIQRIANTMKTISAARWRTGKHALEKARNFVEQLERILSLFGPQHAPREGTHPLLVALFPDRGLVGGFSTLLAQEIFRFLKNEQFSNPRIIILGTQGKRALQALEEYVVAFHPLPVHQMPHYRDVRDLVYEIFRMEKEGLFTHLYVGFMGYVSLSERKPRVEQILPFPATSPASREEYLLLSDVPSLHRSLLFEYVAGKLYRALAESFMSEQAARFVLMDTAATHAQETLDNLLLLYAKQRQESITQELNEVTGAAEALRRFAG